MSDGEWAIIAIEQCGRIVKYHMHLERMLQDIANRSGLQQIVYLDRKGREGAKKKRRWQILEMTTFSQSPRDRILWILVNNGGKMERSRLRARTGMRYALLG